MFKCPGLQWGSGVVFALGGGTHRTNRAMSREIEAPIFNKRFASELLAFDILNLHQVYANISETNVASLTLFENNGFEKIGLKKDWSYDGKSYSNEFILQRINH